MALDLDRNRKVPRAPSWPLKGLLWCGPLLLTLVLGVETARATSVTWTGAITDTSTGNSGTVVQTFNLNYTPITTTATSLTEAISGSGTTTSNLPALSIPVDIMLKKMVANTLLNPIPNPPISSPPIFASLTNETYNDPFTVSSPLFTFNGTYSRTPSTVTGNYSASINEAALPNFTGYFSFQGSLTPGSPGNATTQTTVTAALVGGGTLTFDVQSTLEFNPTIHLVGPEISFGSETITVNPDSSFSFTGITTVQLVPEPSSFGLLGAGLLVCARLLVVVSLRSDRPTRSSIGLCGLTGPGIQVGSLRLQADPQLLQGLLKRRSLIVGDRDGFGAEPIAEPGAGCGVLEQSIEELGAGQIEDHHAGRLQRRDP